MARHTRYEAIHHFVSEESRAAFLELTNGLLRKDAGEYVHTRTGDPEDEQFHYQRRLGIALLTAFKRPNQSVELEDFMIAAADFKYHSVASVKSYLHEMANEGVVASHGRGHNSWYLTKEFKNDPASPVRSDVDVVATRHELPSGLELSEAGSHRCGDQGHSHQDPGHRG
jgi:hypothetical protein